MTLVFSSVTYALKAQRLLAEQRIYTVLSRSPQVTAVRGCGYGLRLKEPGQLDEALRLLAEGGVRHIGTVRE